MTRYFLDTEFLEDGKTIELISIGIVSEEGREYYAEAPMSGLLRRVVEHEWLMENVVPHLSGEWKPKQQIADEVRDFCHPGGEPEFWAYCGAYDWVVINQLFGSMVEHPSRWPFYCNDIAQLGEHIGISRRRFPEQTTVAHNALSDAHWTKDTYYWLIDQQGNKHAPNS